MTNRKAFLIGAVSHKGIYGLGRGAEGKIPWKSKLDMNFFTEITKGTGKHGQNDVAMSRGMWLALPEKYRPLPGRGNVVITSNTAFQLSEIHKANHVRIARSVQEAQEISQAGELYFAGGQDVWLNAQDVADELLINVVNVEVNPLSEDGTLQEIVYFDHLLDPTILWPEFVLTEKRIETEIKKDGTSFDIEFRRYVRQ